MKTTALIPWLGLGALLWFMFKPEEAQAGNGGNGPPPPPGLKARLAAIQSAGVLPNPCFSRVSRASARVQVDLVPSS